MGTFFMILGWLATIAIIVLLYVKIIPKKLDGTFSSKILQFFHDYFNFKKFYIESVLRFFFILATVAAEVFCVIGFLSTTFSFFEGFQYLEYVPFSSLFGAYLQSIFALVVVMIVAPIITRLIYEGMMMFIVLVRNVQELNSKTKKQD